METRTICGSCMEKKTKEKIFISSNVSCNQEVSFFFDCIGRYVASKLLENIFKVKCPYLGCNEFFEPQDRRSAVPEQVVAVWKAATIHTTRSQLITKSPHDKVNNDIGEKKAVTTSAKSTRRLGLFCIPRWRAGSKCKKRKRHMNVEYLDKRFRGVVKLENWTRCPNCKIHVEKKSGCGHMPCRPYQRSCSKRYQECSSKAINQQRALSLDKSLHQICWQ